MDGARTFDRRKRRRGIHHREQSLPGQGTGQRADAQERRGTPARAGAGRPGLGLSRPQSLRRAGDRQQGAARTETSVLSVAAVASAVRLFRNLALANRLRPVDVDGDLADLVDLAVAAEGKLVELVAEVAAADLSGDGAVPDLVDAAVGDVAEDLLAAVVDAAKHQVAVEHDVG